MKSNIALLLALMVGLPLLAAAQSRNSNRRNPNSRNSTTTTTERTTTERPTTRNSSSEERWKVEIRQGSIEAPMTKKDDGTMYYAFKNIPYAEPPVGDLRFKNPVAGGSWTGVRDGTVSSSICPQMDKKDKSQGKKKVTGDEDCLYLDVYVPKRNASEFPVMVWIHGGGFMGGSGQEYNPAPFMTRNVVVVIIQYRIGPMGFMSTEDSVMSGNYGLKDQIMALEWVKNNIQYFGGDPNRVTIFGQSAGSNSVHLLMHSPKARDLFQNAIAQSGSGLFPGLIRDDHRMTAAKMGQMLNCSNDTASDLNSQRLYDCLKNVSAEKLVMTTYNFGSFGRSSVMRPRVDGEVLLKHPAQMLREGTYNNVNLMAGCNKDEGGMVLRYLLQKDADLEELARNFSARGPALIQMEEGPHTEYMAKRLFAQYLGGFNITEENADQAVKMITDYWCLIPLDVTAKMLAKEYPSQKVYLYEFQHAGENHSPDSPKLSVGKNWVDHGDDLQYLFDFSQSKPLTNPVDIFMSDVMLSLWTNFAETGNPTPDLSLGFKWRPVSGEDLQHLILKPAPYMKNNTRDMEFEFMTNLPSEQNQLLYPERFVKERH